MQEKNYHHGDLKSELIRQGLIILDREGYDGLSLRKVAKACSVSQTAPYRHFASKDELVSAILDQAMERFDSRLAGAVAMHPGDDARAQLKEMGFQYICFFSENPEYLRLLFMGDLMKTEFGFGYSEGSACEARERQGSVHPFITFSQAVERYRISSKDCTMSQRELVLYCWGLVHGIATLIAFGKESDMAAQLENAKKTLWSEDLLK